MRDESPYEKLRREFEVLMGQNNTVMRETPAYTVAKLFQLVDHERRKHGLDINDVSDEGDGRYLIELEADERTQAAVLGVEDPGDLEDLNLAMLDDRRIGGST